MWWSTHPIVYTLDDFEGHRTRLLIAEKAPYCGTEILDDFVGAGPEFLDVINPNKYYPLYVDRQLVCYGAALDELIHERYPSPSLLPADPIKRAQVRMLAADVRSWYVFALEDQIKEKLAEFAASYDTSVRYFAGDAICIVDIAAAPLLYWARQRSWNIEVDTSFRSYVDRLLNRPGFAASLLPMTTPNALTISESAFDEEI